MFPKVYNHENLKLKNKMASAHIIIQKYGSYYDFFIMKF